MKTKYNWSKASKNAKYIFTDQDGDVFESNCEPLLCNSGWRATGFNSWWYHSDVVKLKGNWQDSLEERPHD